MNRARSLLGAFTQQTVNVLDIQDEPEHPWTALPAFQPYHSAMGVPMVRDGALLGVMVMIRTEVKAFGEREIALVETFADQAVIAIENTRLFEEVEDRNRDLSVALEQQTTTSEILRVIAALRPMCSRS